MKQSHHHQEKLAAGLANLHFHFEVQLLHHLTSQLLQIPYVLLFVLSISILKLLFELLALMFFEFSTSLAVSQHFP